MLDAKAAVAGASWNPGCVIGPVEREGDVAAVAFAVDPHVISPLCFRLRAVRERGAARQAVSRDRALDRPEDKGRAR